VTVADPATWFFETAGISEKTADTMANCLEIHWLTQCPWPAEMDKGKELAREVSETLKTSVVLNGRLSSGAICKQTP